MYLKQIELENFKSFGKKLSIPLLEGFTVVTGPNGSGKSNISDAILFVLGPSSSRAIRAGRLTDLIFNGGKSKSPASYTKVSLVFDNEDRMIPLDKDTVKLTRLVKLSDNETGYNSYFYVDGRKSTLREFDSLLSNSRISADGYNLVQQGDVTNIVEMTDLERRKILDDISGISKFDEDIEDAEEEREEAEDNIERISIILDELEKQIEQLKEEKETTSRYLELKEQLNVSKAQMAHKKRESIKREIQAIKEQIEDQEEEINRLKERKKEILVKIEEVRTKIEEAEQEIEDKGGEEFRELKEKIDETRIELARAQDARERALDEIDEIESALEKRGKEKEELKSKLESLTQQLEETNSLHEEKSAVLQEKNERIEKIQEKMRSCDDELEELEKKKLELDEGLGNKKEETHDLKLKIERLEDKKERLETNIAYIEEKIKNNKFEINDLDWNIKDIKKRAKNSSQKIKEVQEELHEKKNLEDKLSRQAEELEQAVKRLTRKYNHLKAEKEAAENIARGYTQSVRAVLEARDRGQIRGIHGTIAELAQVEEEYEVALNTAAGGRMQSIVVEDDEVAATAINFLKKNDLGRATFLPLNKMKARRPRAKAIRAVKKTIGYAIDLIHFDEKYKGAFSYVFGDTIVVKTLNKARELMGGVRLVTLDGDLIEASGAMVGGTSYTGNLKFGSSSKGKLEEVGKELQEAIEQSDVVSEKLKKVRDEMTELENKLRELKSVGSNKEENLESLNSKKEELKNELNKLKEDKKEKVSEAQQIDNTLEGLSEKLSQTDTEIQELEEKREDIRDRIMELAPKNLSSELKDLQHETHELTNTVSELKKQRESLETQISLTKERLEEMISLEKEAENKTQELESEASDCQQKESELRKELKGLRKLEDSLGDEMKALREKRDKLFKEETSLEAEEDKVEEKIETSKDFSIGLETKLSTAEDDLEEINEEIESYEVEVEYPLPKLEELKKRIREQEDAISSMGAVNLRAIDDYEQKKERYTNLQEETGRLEEQKKELLSLMKKLNEKKKTAFFEVFEAVNENFVRIYSDLSGGGEAKLQLEYPKEPFDGGLIIKAKPKAGKTLRLQALSGGEKSLTALSLIFAIQEYLPSPFYLLDEVDMFLDAVNADMVARRIKKASQRAQFVLITLRKVTMNKADHMIGVTMKDNGVSKIVMKPDMSEELSDINLPEEAAEEGAS